MITEQTKNYIILIIVLILIIGGVYYKRAQAPSEISTPPDLTPPPAPLSIHKWRGDGGEGVIKAEPTLSYEEYLQQGINYENKGELNKAIDSYKKASELFPKEYVPYSNAGSAYHSLKNFPEAERHFLKAIELSPNNVSVYTKLYDLYFYGLKRNRDQMNTFFADAMKDTNNDINIVKLYAMYLEGINNFESALAIWQSLLEFEPENESYKAKVEELRKKIEANP